MNKEKLEALKTLGFEYITRDMDGKLTAWMNRPTRIVTCLEENKEKVIEDYGLETKICIESIDEYDDLDEWKDGFFTTMSRFNFSEKDFDESIVSTGHFELLEISNEFVEITWQNSPYKINDKLNQKKRY